MRIKKVFRHCIAKIARNDNVEYVLKDKDGNVKPIFCLNFIGKFLKKRSYSVPNIPFLFGFWRKSLKLSNLVTNAGLAGEASRNNGSGAEAAFTYLAIGIGTTAANVADTTLESEITTNGGERGAGTASRVTTDVTNDTAQLILTFNFTGTFAVTESGVLNAASAGTLLARQVFAAINVISGDSLQVTWKFDMD